MEESTHESTAHSLCEWEYTALTLAASSHHGNTDANGHANNGTDAKTFHDSFQLDYNTSAMKFK